MDQIPAIYLKEAVDVLTYPLSRIINLSVKLSVFPEECNIVTLKTDLRKHQKPIAKSTDLLQFCLYVQNY